MVLSWGTGVGFSGGCGRLQRVDCAIYEFHRRFESIRRVTKVINESPSGEKMLHSVVETALCKLACPGRLAREPVHRDADPVAPSNPQRLLPEDLELLGFAEGEHSRAAIFMCDTHSFCIDAGNHDGDVIHGSRGILLECTVQTRWDPWIWTANDRSGIDDRRPRSS